MRKGKDIYISFLLDFYSPMLTEKQHEALDLYYNEDLSLSEISEQWGITRQGVREIIKRGEQILTGLEEKLGLAGRFRSLEALCDRLEGLDVPDEGTKEEICGIAEQIRNII
ncbi:MAG: DNA-binding protein [Oscillospiraceae bacterium]|nr:DNA-binding protein [Oscillospiraceae bacterium]